MAKTATSHVINATKVRLGRAEQDMAGLVEILRAAAAEPNYDGPNPESGEQIVATLAEVRATVHGWVIDRALRRWPRPGLRRTVYDLAVIRSLPNS